MGYDDSCCGICIGFLADSNLTQRVSCDDEFLVLDIDLCWFLDGGLVAMEDMLG